MKQELKVWGLTKREAVLWLGLLGIASGGTGFILLILWWLDYDKRSKQD
jgi:hypothetical protein